MSGQRGTRLPDQQAQASKPGPGQPEASDKLQRAGSPLLHLLFGLVPVAGNDVVLQRVVLLILHAQWMALLVD